MDELTVRVYIQKLTKKLIPEFDKVLDSKERIKLVLNEANVGLYDFLVFIDLLFCSENHLKNTNARRKSMRV